MLLHWHQSRFWSTSPPMTSSLTSTLTGRYNFPHPVWYPGSPVSPTGDRRACAWEVPLAVGELPLPPAHDARRLMADPGFLTCRQRSGKADDRGVGA